MMDFLRGIAVRALEVEVGNWYSREFGGEVYVTEVEETSYSGVMQRPDIGYVANAQVTLGMMIDVDYTSKIPLIAELISDGGRGIFEHDADIDFEVGVYYYDTYNESNIDRGKNPTIEIYGGVSWSMVRRIGGLDWVSDNSGILTLKDNDISQIYDIEGAVFENVASIVNDF